MALTKCNECGHMVSDKAEMCPKCGCPIQNVDNPSVKETSVKPQPPKNKKSKMWSLTAVLLCLLIGGGYLIFDKFQNSDKDKQMTDSVEIGAESTPSSEEFSVVGKVYRGSGNGGGLYTEMSISFFADKKCRCVSDWYRAYDEPKSIECSYEVEEDKIIVYYKRDDISGKFVFDIVEDGRVLGFNNSDESIEGTMGLDFMTLELEDE